MATGNPAMGTAWCDVMLTSRRWRHIYEK